MLRLLVSKYSSTILVTKRQCTMSNAFTEHGVIGIIFGNSYSFQTTEMFFYIEIG